MSEINERCVEYSFVFNCIIKYSPKRVLDVGTGQTALPSLISACNIECDAIDNDPKQIAKNKALKPKNIDVMDVDDHIKYDMITCISVLEHIEDYSSVVNKMRKLLWPGGHMVLTFPFHIDDYIDNVYLHPDAGYGRTSGNLCRVYNMERLKIWESYGLRLSMLKLWKVFSGKYWTMGKRLDVPYVSEGFRDHQLACIAMERVQE